MQKPRMSRYYYACLIDLCNMNASCKDCPIWSSMANECGLTDACNEIGAYYKKVAKMDGKRLKEAYSNLQTKIDY